MSAVVERLSSRHCLTQPAGKWSVQAVPGKGLGAVASVVLEPGDCILVERPLFLLSASDLSHARSLGRQAEEAFILTHVENLSAADRDAFWALSDCHAGQSSKTASGICRTNPIATADDPSVNCRYGVYSLGCRFNHSCTPNVNRCWIEELQAEAFHVVQDLEPGEELCIYYVDPTSVRAQRQARLQESFNFMCTCEVCSLTGEDREESDRLRNEYQELDRKIMSMTSDPASAIDAVLRMLEINQCEFEGDPHLAKRVFHDGYQMAVLAEDMDLAGCMLQRAYEAAVLAEGIHNETLKLKSWAENPDSHPFKSGLGCRSSEAATLKCEPCGPDGAEDEVEVAEDTRADFPACEVNLAALD